MFRTASWLSCFFSVSSFFLSSSGLADGNPAWRRDLASGIFTYIYKHAVRLDEDQTQWACDETYETHLAAKRLYDQAVMLKDIAMPRDGYKKGCFDENDLNRFDYYWLMFRLCEMIDKPCLKS